MTRATAWSLKQWSTSIYRKNVHLLSIPQTTDPSSRETGQINLVANIRSLQWKLSYQGNKSGVQWWLKFITMPENCFKKSLWPKVWVPGLWLVSPAGKDHSGHSFLARWHHPYNQGFHQMILTDVIFKLCWNAYFIITIMFRSWDSNLYHFFAFWAIISLSSTAQKVDEIFCRPADEKMTLEEKIGQLTSPLVVTSLQDTGIKFKHCHQDQSRQSRWAFWTSSR